jgi:hypothetical protein
MFRFKGFLVFSFGLFLWMHSSASAQVTMKLKMDNVKNLTFDPIWVELTLENLSGNTLVFPKGGKTSSLYFEIINESGKLMLPTSIFQDPVVGLKFLAGARIRRRIVLSNLYNLALKGTYTCRAVVRHASLPAEYISNSVSFQVVDPPCVWTFTVGVPLAPGEHVIKNVTYKVMLFDKSNKPTYYVRVENKKYVFSNIMLQLKNSSHPPSFAVDSQSNLHCLLYNHGKIFTYYLINPKGKVLNMVQHLITETTPRLVKDPDIGRVMVIGGRVAKRGVDYLNYRRQQHEYELDRERRASEKRHYSEELKKNKK